MSRNSPDNYEACIAAEERPVKLEYTGTGETDVVATAESITRGEFVPTVSEDTIRHFPEVGRLEADRRQQATKKLGPLATAISYLRYMPIPWL